MLESFSSVASIAEPPSLRSEHLLATTLDGVRIGVWEIDLATRLVQHNAALDHLFGFTPQAAPRPAEEYLARIHPEDVVRLSEAVGPTSATQPMSTFEGRVQWPDGALRWFTLRGQGVQGDDGVVQRVIGVFIDITNRKQAELAGQQALTRFRRLQMATAALSGAVTVNDVAAEIVHQGVKALGASAGSVTRLTADGASLEIVRAWGYGSEVVRPWQQFPMALVAPVTDAVRNHTAVMLHNAAAWDASYPHLQTVRQSSPHAAWAALPLLLGERVLGGLALSFDSPQAFIPDDVALMQTFAQQCAQSLERARLYEAEQTARQAAEQAQQQQAWLVETSRALNGSLDLRTLNATLGRLVVSALADYYVLYLVDGEGGLYPSAWLHHNAEQEATLQTVLQRLVGQKDAMPVLKQVLHSKAPLFIADIATALAETPSSVDRALIEAMAVCQLIVVPLLVRDEVCGILSFGATGQARFDAGQFALVIAFAAQYAQALENARLYQQSLEAISMRDDFLSIAAHELKTPLAALNGNAALVLRRAMRENMLSERDQRGLQMVIDQGERLNRMINQLLDIGRLQQSGIALNRAPVDVGALVRRITDELQPTLSRHTLEMALPDDPLLVMGDELRLEQVVQNLCQNAVKYNPQGGPVWVTLARHEQQVVISVRDTGIGIPTDAVPHIFQRFYRAPNTEAFNISGMGVGLYVVREIVTLHGGDVQVATSEGQGSTFTITLPLLG